MTRKRKPEADPKVYATLSKEAYKDNNDVQDRDGFILDRELSDRETKVFVNENTRTVVLSFRGTKEAKDIGSDVAIATGYEDYNPRFKGSLKKFDEVYAKYGNSYTYDTTGHSLGGQLATYVDRNRDNVHENLSFSRGSGVGELFRSRPENTYDYSNSKDIVAFGSRMNTDSSVPAKLFHLVTATPGQLLLEGIYNNFVSKPGSAVRNDLNFNPLKAHEINLDWL
jgi:hypothetical protein